MGQKNVKPFWGFPPPPTIHQTEKIICPGGKKKLPSSSMFLMLWFWFFLSGPKTYADAVKSPVVARVSTCSYPRLRPTAIVKQWWVIFETSCLFIGNRSIRYWWPHFSILCNSLGNSYEIDCLCFSHFTCSGHSYVFLSISNCHFSVSVTVSLSDIFLLIISLDVQRILIVFWF